MHLSFVTTPPQSGEGGRGGGGGNRGKIDFSSSRKKHPAKSPTLR